MAPSMARLATAPATIPPIAPPENFECLFCVEDCAEGAVDDEGRSVGSVEFAQKSLISLFSLSTATILESVGAVFACHTEKRPAS
jgi:hypothetical protein